SLTPTQLGGRDGDAERAERGQQLRGRRHPAEDAALRGDHPEAHLVELREVRADAVGEHEALEPAVVGLANRRVNAHLGGDAGHDQVRDAVVAQDLLEVGGVERALVGLVEDDLAVEGRDGVDDVVAVLAADEDPALRARAADARVEAPAGELGRRAGAGGGAGASTTGAGSIVRARRPTSLPSSSPNPPGSRKSRWKSISRRAVRRGAS